MESDSELTVREQIFNFLHLSNDMYRNQDDADFSEGVTPYEGRGQIIYCFDATVFNLFFDTFQWRYAVSSFYSEDWSSRATSEQWRRIEAQSALIAAEYLLSERLPGAKSRNLYLTPWHRAELALNLNRIVGAFRKGAYEKHAILEEIKLKLALLQASVRETGRNQTAEVDNEDLMRDLEGLRPYFGSNQAALERYEFTRRVASVLVRCENSERLDQIHRLVSKPLRNRISGLHHLFPVNDDERQEIERDAIKWFGRIASEVARDRPEPNRPRRTRGAMWNDARTLAFVRSAATRKARPDQRVVLVTSDNKLFDAYRRWWVETGELSGEPDEPFFLRRSFQYTPIFNLSDSSNDISQSGAMRKEIKKLFSRIREAVEVALLPFNLSNVPKAGLANSAYSRTRGREYLALRTRDYRAGKEDLTIDFLMKTLDENWFKQQHAAISDIASLWRQIERVGIGFFHDKILKRLEDDRNLFGIDIDESSPMLLSGNILEYFTKSLEALTQKTRAAWFPAVQAFLEQQRPTDINVPGRAPETLWYQLPDGRKIYDAITKWTPAEIRTVESAPEGPFVFASAAAMRRAQWWKAEEFADYAIEACRDLGPSSEIFWEVRFLSALTKRFRLGSMGLHLDVSIPPKHTSAALACQKRSVEIYREAKRLIDDCVLHFSAAPKSESSTLALIRAKSERAALKLFLSTSVLFTNSSLSPLTDQPAVPNLIHEAQDDILDCVKLDTTARNNPDRRALRRQYLHNGAASEVIRFSICPNRTFEINYSFVRKIAAGLEEEDFKPLQRNNPLLGVEQITFFILAHKAEVTAYSLLESALVEGMHSELPVDRALCRSIGDAKGILFDMLKVAKRKDGRSNN